MRSRLRAQPGSQAGRGVRAVERVRVRRHQRHARLPQIPLLEPARVAELQQRLGHSFREASVLERALTHASYANEHPPVADNAALALLGDAALGLVVAEHLVGEDATATVGVLTSRRAELVSGANLARWARHLGLGPLVRLGRGEEQTGGSERESILATTLEAVLGAVYLDGGVAAVRTAVARMALW